MWWGGIAAQEPEGKASANRGKPELSRECKLDVLFLQHIMAEVMDPINKHFQRAGPLAATTRRTLEGFVRKLQSGFVQPSQTRGNLPSAVNHTARSHQKADEDLLVGEGVKVYLAKLQSDAKAEQNESKREQKLQGIQKLKDKFFPTVRQFYIAATSYAKKSFLLNNPVLQHAEVADPALRDSVKYSSAEFFLHRYPAMLPDSCKQQDLQREFTEYQELSDDEIPSKEKMDSRWTALATLKDEVGALKFTHLPSVMLSILSIPVSQAEAELQFCGQEELGWWKERDGPRHSQGTSDPESPWEPGPLPPKELQQWGTKEAQISLLQELTEIS